MDMSVKIGSVELKNPVLTASGCFGVGREYGELYDVSVLGGIVTKTVTLEPRAGNKPPRICETPAGMLNSIGLANPGVEGFIEAEIPFLEKLSTVRVVSVAGKAVEDFAEVIRRLTDLDAVDIFELNVSCPNVEKGIAFGTDPKLVADLVSACRKITRKDIWVKLTPNVTDITIPASAAIDSGADALTAINTVQGMAVDIDSCKPMIGNVFAGLSGPAIHPVALAKVHQLRRAFADFPIVGVGGIGSAEDVVAMMIAGANAVQIGSGQFPNPNLPLMAIAGIGEYCHEKGYRSVREITDSLQAG
ncbi:MAG TPA: dihydroorotate dehydrogenase [candidate division Zixibacteria bacterium]|nr:dihydroorotate dehydrogenase [candidate division Zixibacteria bacterium]